MADIPTRHYLSYLQEVMVAHWQQPILTDYETRHEYTFASLAEKMERLRLLFDALDIRKGEHIAICARSCSNWAATFLAITAAERVAVSILPDYAAEDIVNIVNHSDSKLLFVDTYVGKRLDMSKLDHLYGIVSLNDFSPLTNIDYISSAFANAEDKFTSLYPNGMRAKEVLFPINNFDALAMLNYTSGTTGSPKGVMLTFRNLSSNVTFGQTAFPSKDGDTMLSILPLAHIFGLMYELLYQIAGGVHIYYLTRTPTPSVLINALQEVKPCMMMSVPLVIEKIVQKKVMPVLERPLVKLLWNTPLFCHILERKIRKELLHAFGGKLNFVIIGGAAFSEEAEKVLRRIRFPYTCGYGMTECAPLISYTPWDKYKPRTVGAVVHRMQVKTDSSNGVGELLVNGENVMTGYYMNEKATADTFTTDGWLRTGDMGYVDDDGNIVISGRCKTMILGASGQNIYPEEIESKLRAISGVNETIVVEREQRLVALVYPDDSVWQCEEEWTQQTLHTINKRLPQYSQLSSLELQHSPFPKTAKHSIRRTF